MGAAAESRQGDDRSRVSPNASVIIPDLNATMTRLETLQFSTCQTRVPFEILGIDDSANDQMSAIAAERGADDHRIT